MTAPDQERKAILERIDDSMRRVAAMCSERRGPRMSIPARPEYDDDLFICDTLRMCRAALTPAPTPDSTREAKARCIGPDSSACCPLHGDVVEDCRRHRAATYFRMTSTAAGQALDDALDCLYGDRATRNNLFCAIDAYVAALSGAPRGEPSEDAIRDIAWRGLADRETCREESCATCAEKVDDFVRCYFFPAPVAPSRPEPNGPGSPMARLDWLLDELWKRLPESHPGVFSDPPEPRIIAALDARLAPSRATGEPE